jgi:hypothetical protein
MSRLVINLAAIFLSKPTLRHQDGGNHERQPTRGTAFQTVAVRMVLSLSARAASRFHLNGASRRRNILAK